MTLLLIVQSAINTHEFYSRGIVAGFQRRPDAAKSLRPAPRNFKCGADRLRRVRLVGHLMLLPEAPLALTLIDFCQSSSASLLDVSLPKCSSRIFRSFDSASCRVWRCGEPPYWSSPVFIRLAIDPLSIALG